MPDYTDDMRWVSALFTKIDLLERRTGALVLANETTEQRIMSITDDLKAAAVKTSDAVTLLDAKVDLLITSQQNVVAQLTSALAANTGSGVDAAAVQEAIDTLNAATSAATSESGKVDIALTPPPAQSPAASTPPTAPTAPAAPVAPVATTPTNDPEVAAQAAVASQHADPTASTTGVVGAIPVTDSQIAASSPSIDSGAAITSTTPNVAPLAAASSTVTPANGSPTTP